MNEDSAAGGSADGLDGARVPFAGLSPKQVLRIVLPSFVVSMALAVVGVVLFVYGYQVIGLVLVVVATVGGLAVRARLVYRAQDRRRSEPS
ncbi:MAG: hypothetical protein M0T80_11015 [Actinomycetota bacterium]|nr:hypothetical protein [Actinomycetota bacterium]